MQSTKIFNKINFIAELLSDTIILSDSQNLVSFIVTDNIRNTEIDKVEFRLLPKPQSSRDTTPPTPIQDWIEMTNVGSNEYNLTFTPTFVESNDTGVFELRITDIDSNVNYLSKSTISLKVL